MNTTNSMIPPSVEYEVLSIGSDPELVFTRAERSESRFTIHSSGAKAGSGETLKGLTGRGSLLTYVTSIGRLQGGPRFLKPLPVEIRLNPTMVQIHAEELSLFAAGDTYQEAFEEFESLFREQHEYYSCAKPEILSERANAIAHNFAAILPLKAGSCL